MNNLTDSRAGKYYAEIYALTPKEGIVMATVSARTMNANFSWLYSPFLIYGSLGIFFGIFFISMIIQIISRSIDFKRTLLTISVAFIVASVPISLKTALEFTSTQTRAVPEDIPQNIIIQQKTPSSVVISWNIQTERLGSVRFGKAPLNLDEARLTISNAGQKSSFHSVELTKLEPGGEYEAEILSGDRWFNDQGQPIKISIP
ncbi:MAG: hypothetical protein UR52_C0002G0109 [Candidatus Gottesmanbacteria bacterium GW2011_GWA1_34_13]|uniref:Fibronectin type-III domain-containing protein n=1 Tax=Candidatus Gottesmanbacteria bacterium GW2011_GWA1_34_13 TaxID=1618434 RepID=A0A0G0B834_9BACT|nr:MAG: hypothetical protein UR52_C0002G0109 [Candidatus Gottesmanbacteria bacterium GW2011_GWA1_34_13]